MNISKTCLLAGLDRTLLTLWVGGLWISGYLVAPVLFSMLDDRQLAGQLAGQVFQIVNYIGLVAGSYLILSFITTNATTNKNALLKQWRLWALAIMLLLVIIAAFVIQPMMQDLKLQGIAEGSVQAKQFRRLHGVSSVMFLITSVLGLLLVALGIHKTPSEQKH